MLRCGGAQLTMLERLDWSVIWDIGGYVSWGARVVWWEILCTNIARTVAHPILTSHRPTGCWTPRPDLRCGIKTWIVSVTLSTLEPLNRFHCTVQESERTGESDRIFLERIVIVHRQKMTAYSFARHAFGLIFAIQMALFARILSSGGAFAQRLVDFQVAQPPPVPHDAKQCTIQVFQWVSGQ